MWACVRYEDGCDWFHRKPQNCKCSRCGGVIVEVHRLPVMTNKGLVEVQSREYRRRCVEGNGPPRVGFFRVNGLGDVLMTTIAARAYKALGYYTVLITQPAYANLIRRCSDVDEVIEATECPTDYDRYFRLFNLDVGGNPFDFAPGWHDNERIDLLLSSVGVSFTEKLNKCPRLNITPEDIIWVRALFRFLSIPSYELLIGFVPFSESPRRSLTVDGAFRVARLLLNRFPEARLLWFLADGDEIVLPVDIRDRSYMFIGMPLVFLAALMSQLSGVVCVDSGLMHVGAALGLRQIVLFSEIDPKTRISYYPGVVTLYNPDCCSQWPCEYKGDCVNTPCISNIGDDQWAEALEAVGFVGGCMEVGGVIEQDVNKLLDVCSLTDEVNQEIIGHRILALGVYELNLSDIVRFSTKRLVVDVWGGYNGNFVNGQVYSCSLEQLLSGLCLWDTILLGNGFWQQPDPLSALVRILTQWKPARVISGSLPKDFMSCWEGRIQGSLCIIDRPPARLRNNEQRIARIRPSSEANIRRILVMRWDEGMGDILTITAILASLRSHYEPCYIVVGVRAEYACLFDGLEDLVDQVCTVEGSIDLTQFDMIWDLTRFFERERYPQDKEPAISKCRIDLLYDDAFQMIAVDRRPVYRVTSEERELAAANVQVNEGVKRVGFHLDAAGVVRSYPVAWFLEVLRGLEAYPVQCYLFGSERGKHSWIDYKGIRAPNLVNRTGLPLRQTAAEMEQMDLNVVVDSGLMHLSAALQRPTVALMGTIYPFLRTLRYDCVDELFPYAELPCVPCNDVLWSKNSVSACHRLDSSGNPGLCLWRLEPRRVVTKIGLCLGFIDRPINPPRLSVAMMTYNEEAWIATCLEQFYDVVDEIVVVDDSVDRTRDILASFDKVRILDREERQCPAECSYCVERGIDYASLSRPCSAKLRQQSFEACTGDWVLRIDADEILIPDDARKIRQLADWSDVLFPNVEIFCFPTVNFFGDADHYKVGKQGEHEWFPDWHTRLYRMTRFRWIWTKLAHEVLVGRGGFLDWGWQWPSYKCNWLRFYHYGYLEPKATRQVDAMKYKQMGVPLHVLDRYNVEPWVWKKPNVVLPSGWGCGIEYSDGELG